MSRYVSPCQSLSCPVPQCEGSRFSDIILLPQPALTLRPFILQWKHRFPQRLKENRAREFITEHSLSRDVLTVLEHGSAMRAGLQEIHGEYHTTQTTLILLTRETGDHKHPS